MELVGNSFSFGWEVALMEWLQAHLSDSAISTISTLSMFGEELLIILTLGIFYWGIDKRIGKQIGLSLLLINVWNPMIKNIVIRRRPYFDHENISIKRVVDPSADPSNIAAQGYSFPSGHSANAAGLYGSLALYFKKRWLIIAAIILVILVGFSRVVVGAHYGTPPAPAQRV